MPLGAMLTSANNVFCLPTFAWLWSRIAMMLRAEILPPGCSKTSVRQHLIPNIRHKKVFVFRFPDRPIKLNATASFSASEQNKKNNYLWTDSCGPWPWAKKLINRQLTQEFDELTTAREINVLVGFLCHSFYRTSISNSFEVFHLRIH